MIKKEIIDLVVSRTKITKRELIEKDLILHRLLTELEENLQFKEDYVFKGGTCLTKCYLGYYRFSEDLDFTYINQKKFDNKNQSQIRKFLSVKIDDNCKIIESISKEIGLDFKSDKKNVRYIQFGGSNRFVTFRLWYISEEEKKENFIKIQINFVEKLFYPINKVSANNLFFGMYDTSQLLFFFPEESEWLLKIPNLNCYNLEEILTEKIRAILTRKGTKGRDFLDVFLILSKNKDIELNSLKKKILEKINFALKYEEYAINFKNKSLDFIENFQLGDEQKLLIKEIPPKFYNFLKEFKRFLKSIIEELNSISILK
jgi:predicted nucleotidyltransferase component of viral defense system